MRPARLGTKNDCAGEDDHNLPDPTQAHSRRELHDSQSRKRVKYVHETRRAGNQEWLCWRRPLAIYPTNRAWVGPISDLNPMKRKICPLARDPNPIIQLSRPQTSHYTEWTTLYLFNDVPIISLVIWHCMINDGWFTDTNDWMTLLFQLHINCSVKFEDGWLTDLVISQFNEAISVT
jgi:hypothetical protein